MSNLDFFVPLFICLSIHPLDKINSIFVEDNITFLIQDRTNFVFIQDKNNMSINSIFEPFPFLDQLCFDS